MDGLQNDICFGAVIGFIVAGLMGFLLVQIRASRAIMGRRYQRAGTFPDASQPGLTAPRIFGITCLALVSFIFWLLIMIGLVVYVIRWALPNLGIGT
jgi:hypothetical protein